MAKTPTPSQEPATNAAEEVSAPHGAGGSYVVGTDGVRRLVDRTVDRVIRDADEVNRKKED